MHPDWARTLRDQCNAANVPFFFKQWGEYLCAAQATNDQLESLGRENAGIRMPDDRIAWRVGKAAAGHLLDGIEHHAFPVGQAFLPVHPEPRA
jgi:hypothetical protein